MSEKTISELIATLENYKQLYGDLPVRVGSLNHMDDADRVFVYCESENAPKRLLIHHYDEHAEKLKSMAETAQALIEKQGATEQ